MSKCFNCGGDFGEHSGGCVVGKQSARDQEERHLQALYSSQRAKQKHLAELADLERQRQQAQAQWEASRRELQALKDDAIAAAQLAAGKAAAEAQEKIAAEAYAAAHPEAATGHEGDAAKRFALLEVDQDIAKPDAVVVYLPTRERAK